MSINKICEPQPTNPNLRYRWLYFVAYFVLPLIALLGLVVAFDLPLFNGRLWYGYPDPTTMQLIKTTSVASLVSATSILAIAGVYKKSWWGYYLIFLFTSIFLLFPLATLIEYSQTGDLWGGVFWVVVCSSLCYLNVIYFKKRRNYFSSIPQ